MKAGPRGPAHNGTVRLRGWITHRGEQRAAWMVDYYSAGWRKQRQFATKRAAEQWLAQLRRNQRKPDPMKAKVAQAARELLDVYEREPELWEHVMTLLSEQDIDTLRKIAAWDRRP